VGRTAVSCLYSDLTIQHCCFYLLPYKCIKIHVKQATLRGNLFCRHGKACYSTGLLWECLCLGGLSVRHGVDCPHIDFIFANTINEVFAFLFCFNSRRFAYDALLLFLKISFSRYLVGFTLCSFCCHEFVYRLSLVGIKSENKLTKQIIRFAYLSMILSNNCLHTYFCDVIGAKR
jgi:hypothetical protein